MENHKNKGREMFADKNLKQGLGQEDNLLGVHSRIAEQLRAFYTGIQEEAIPQKFLTLLEKLDEAEKSEHNSVKQKSEPHRLIEKQGGEHG